MKLEHEFRVPVPVSQAWDVLLDVERIAPCMPGATVESFDGETVTGRVKVKVGPIQVTYGGTARFIEKNESGRRVTLDASGKEARGSGTAKATIVAVLQDEGSSTLVNVTTDLAITGKPAQFGRGVMVEVGNKLLGRFADCLAKEIGIGSASESAEPAESGAPEAAVASSGDGGGPVEAVSGDGGSSGVGEAGDAAAVAAGDATESASGDGGSAVGSAGGVAAESSSGDGPREAASGDGAAEKAAAGATVVDVADGSGNGSADSRGDTPGAAGAGNGAGAAAAPTPSNNGGTTPSPQVRRLAPATANRPSHLPAENEAIDLLDVGGAAILKRVAPLAVGLVLLIVLWRLIRRR
jgi:carbon monoxide dehydrogenase subunit G